MKLRFLIALFSFGFFGIIFSMEPQGRDPLLDSQESWTLWQKIYHGLYIGSVATLAFTGQYLTIKNYYDDHPQSDDLTGVWSGVAVALGVGVAGGLAYVGGKYVINCHENRDRRRLHFIRDENEEL